MEASAVAIGARRSETPAVTWPPAIVAEPKRATFEVAADIADLVNVLEAACGGANSHPENMSDVLLFAVRDLRRCSATLIAIAAVLVEPTGASRCTLPRTYGNTHQNRVGLGTNVS